MFNLQIKYSCIFVIIFILGIVPNSLQIDVEDNNEFQNDEAIVHTEDSQPILSNVVTDVNKTIQSPFNQLAATNISVETKNQTTNETRKLVNCKDIVYESEDVEPTVEIINGSALAKLLQVKPDISSPNVEAECVLVFFHAKSCPFSARAAPHFNALSRSYPNIKMVALDALKYHGINAQYGIVGVPTLKLFHNGRAVGKFNGTEYNVHLFSKFINTFTGQTPQVLLVTSKDFQGPVPSVVEFGTDYFLILSWLFIIICAIYYFMQSKWWNMIVEMIQNNWRESEAQHEHND